MLIDALLAQLQRQRQDAQTNANKASLAAAQAAAKDLEAAASRKAGARLAVSVKPTTNGAVLSVSTNRQFPIRRVMTALEPRRNQQAEELAWRPGVDDVEPQ